MRSGRSILRFVFAALFALAAVTPCLARQADTGPFHLVTTLGRGSVRSVAWSPAGDVIAVGGALGIWLYTPDLGDIGLMTGHRRAVYGLAFNPQGTRLASASHDGTVRIWQIDLQTELFTLEGHTGRVVAVAWSPDGAVVASGSHDGTVRLWDPSEGTALLALEGGHTGWVNQVAFNPAGDQVISAGYDGFIGVWDRASGGLVTRVPGSASEWNALTGQPPEWFLGPQAVFRFTASSPDGSRHALVDWDAGLSVLDSASGATLAARSEHLDWITALRWTDENSLLSEALVTGLRLWNVDQGVLVEDSGQSAGFDSQSPTPLPAPNPDGRYVVSLEPGGVVRIAEAGSGAVVAELPGVANAASWSVGGRLAVAQRNGTITIWSE